MSRQVFALFGTIKLDGIQDVNKRLSEVDRDVKKVTKEIAKFGKNISGIGMSLTKTFTAPILGLGAAFVALAVKTADYGDQLNDLSQVSGLSTDKLQGLRNVATSAGVDFESLATIVSKFTARLPQIQKEGGSATSALLSLGYSSQEVLEKSKNMSSFFPELINKLQGIENITQRNILAQQIFGKDLSVLAPILGMTAEQFNQLMNDSKGFLSQGEIDRADNFKTKMLNLRKTFEDFGIRVGSNIIPLISETLIPLLENSVIPAVGKVIEKVADLAKFWEWLGKPMQAAILTFVAMVAVLGPVMVIVGTAISQITIVIGLYKAWTAAQLTLNAVMTANPIGLIVVGIAALIAAGVLIVKNWGEISKFFVSVWKAMQFGAAEAISAMIQGLLGWVKLVVDTFGIVMRFIPGLKTVYANATNALSDMIEKEKEGRKEREKSFFATEKTTAAVEGLTKAEGELNTAKADSVVLTDKQIESAKKYSDAIREQTTTKIDQLRYEKTKALAEVGTNAKARADVEKYYNLLISDLEIANIEKLEAAQKKAKEEKEKLELDSFNLQVRLLELEDKRQAESDAKKRDDEERTKALLIDSANQVFDITSGLMNMQSIQIDNDYQKQKEMIENSILSEEEKAARMSALDIETDAKKRQLRKDQAIADKAQAIFNIGLSTAQAIMSALTLPPPANFILAGVVGALAAAQLGIVLATPLPFADGGLVKGGSSGVNALIGEAGQDELVLPMQTGVEALATALLTRLQNIEPPSLGGGFGSPDFAGAMAGGGGGGGVSNHWHIGTLIADDRGIKELERRQLQFRVSESQRKGGQ